MKYTIYLVLVFIASVSMAKQRTEAFTLDTTSSHTTSPLSEKQVYNGFGCHGDNLSPALSWKNPPKDTRSFAVTIFDKDAPTGSGWWHWLAFDIPMSVFNLKEGAGVLNAPFKQGPNDFGQKSYGGACPPKGHGVHHYTVTVYALDTQFLPVVATSSAAYIGYMIHEHALAKSTMTLTYKRD
jgi:Raf kinase inhibitor-like YbhB/YbcL family protein